MGLQIIVLPVGLGVLQFGREFPGVSARVEMIGMFAGLLLAPVFTCVQREHTNVTQKQRNNPQNKRRQNRPAPRNNHYRCVRC